MERSIKLPVQLHHLGGPGDRCAGPVVGSGRSGGPDEPGADREYRLAAQETTGWSDVDGADDVWCKDINEAAVAAYRASIDSGKPLSKCKLAAMFGKTSRRWARHRMAEPTRRQMTRAWPGMRSSP